MKTSPLQVLMALAGLGLLIGLPALDQHQDHKRELMSQIESAACASDLSPGNGLKAPRQVKVRSNEAASVSVAPSAAEELTNTPTPHNARLSADVRQTLMQCA